MLSQIMRDLVKITEDLGPSNPMNSIYKYHAIVKEAGSPENIRWSFELLVDMYLSGGYTFDLLSLRSLEGKTRNSGGKGTIDLLCLKGILFGTLKGAWMAKQAWSSNQKEELQRVCESLSTL